MQEKTYELGDLARKAYELGDLVRDVSSVTKSYEQNFHKNVIFLTGDEISRLQKIAGLFASFKIANFSSASKDKEITQQVTAILLNLINGKDEKGNFEEIKQSLHALKQQDEQNIKVFTPISMTSGLLTLGGTLACILMLIFFPAICLFVICIAFSTLCLFALTGYLLKIEMDYKGEILHAAWEDKFGDEIEGVIGLLNALVQSDIELLKKVNSEEWKENFYEQKNTLKEQLENKKYLADDEEPTTFESVYLSESEPEKNNPASFNSLSFSCYEVDLIEYEKNHSKVFNL